MAANARARATGQSPNPWNQLRDEPDNAAFFHLLAQLQGTGEFTWARADLTRRVWDVVSAATSDTELRQILFAPSSSHGT